jgi:CBS domain containing-hemolysin-like protein
VSFFGRYTLWLAAMALLSCGSAFFSASEAAFFYLRPPERRRLALGTHPQRLAARLLQFPERLLTAVLFWNLLVNLIYFTIDSIVVLNLDRGGHPTAAGVFAVGGLLWIIFFGELLPKSLAVLRPPGLAAVVSIPLTIAVRIVDPLLPAFRLTNLLARRLLWPGFQREPYLLTSDLERAVRLSGSDARLVDQERNALEHLVLLSDLRADELMRPRNQLRAFRPPVSLSALEGNSPESGYLLLTEPDSDEVVAAVPLRRLGHIPEEKLQRLAEPVAYVPWCTTAAETLEQLRRQSRRVAAVVNEFGETIGIVTQDDLLDTIFSRESSRSARLLKRQPIRQVAPGVWHVTGMTGLRRLARYFNVPRPPSKSVTVSGAIQEVLERLPAVGDQCRWGPFQLKVLQVPARGQFLVELTLPPQEEPS